MRRQQGDWCTKPAVPRHGQAKAPGHPGAVHVPDIAGSLARALATDPAQRRRTAQELAILYRQGFAALGP